MFAVRVTPRPDNPIEAVTARPPDFPERFMRYRCWVDFGDEWGEGGCRAQPPMAPEPEAFTQATDIKRRGAGVVDMKLEVVVLPVADVNRAKDFYRALGWREDADFATGENFRVVQTIPPGSPARSSSAPGSPRPRRARRRACSWWWPALTRPGPAEPGAST